MSCGLLDEILEQKKEISWGKKKQKTTATRGIQIMFGVWSIVMVITNIIN